MAATIKDIAKVSGFGVGTVSRVLNGGSLVKDKTRQHILQVVKQLNYRPNKLAKMLVTGNYTSSIIGVILPLITHRFFMDIVGGIYNKLNELGYNLLVFNIGTKREQVFKHIEQVDFSGLLILADPLSKEEKSMLATHHSQFIYLDYHEKDEDSIYFNNNMGGRLAATYLVEKKCKRVVFIGDLLNTQQQVERLAGFKEELAAKGLRLIEEMYINIDEEESFRVTENIIRNRKFEGIFYYCDDLALGGLRAKRQLGSKVRIVGYDDIDASAYLGLSTVRQSAAKLGARGAEKIIELIQETASPSDTLAISECLQPELVDRNS
jgi:LacI family transcriptional regulator